MTEIQSCTPPTAGHLPGISLLIFPSAWAATFRLFRISRTLMLKFRPGTAARPVPGKDTHPSYSI